MPNSPSQILLIHGLSRTPLSLIHLKWGLDRRGCRAELFGYAAVVESYDSIARRLHDRLQIMAKRGSYGVVTHSLGGRFAAIGVGVGPDRAACASRDARPAKSTAKIGSDRLEIAAFPLVDGDLW
jgi:pimeloyl-ACP methyl ester carboxylesterase